MADVVNVPLTHENAADVEEVEDRYGAKWRASAVANTWVGNLSCTSTDDLIMTRGTYVRRWKKTGRDPNASATKWRKGYVTQKGASESLGDGPAPIGTVLCNGKDIVTVTSAHYFPAGWVVVREAPQPPAKEPWRRVVVEVRGKGHDARVRIVGDRDGAGLYADAIAAYATPAPDRAKVREMLDGYACGRVTEDAFLDYVCGPAPKDGDA